MGFEVEDFDIANGPKYDLAGDANWGPLYKRITAGEYRAIFSSPPCEAFSRVRNAPRGPPPLRGTVGPDRYGLRELKKRQADLARAHNLLATGATHQMVKQNRIAIFEQPAVRDGEVSMLLLDEFRILLECMEHTRAVQCSFGTTAAKLTSWLTFGTSFSDMTQSCTHPSRIWYEEGTGN